MIAVNGPKKLREPVFLPLSAMKSAFTGIAFWNRPLLVKITRSSAEPFFRR
jgi:hypothetical protein